MAQVISRQATTAASSPPVDVAIAKELSARRSSMVDGRLLDPLPSIVRARMENRRALVTAAMKNATPNEIEEAVAGLMMAYPSMRGLSQIEAQVLIRKYAEDLAGVPLWAIKAASRDISRGAVSDMNPDFPPSAPRVRQLADEHLEWYAKELRDLKMVLTAAVEPPENPEMRARITLGFQKLQQQLGSQDYKPEPSPPEKQGPSWDQIVAAYQAEPGRINRLANAGKKHRCEDQDETS